MTRSDPHSVDERGALVVFETRIALAAPVVPVMPTSRVPLGVLGGVIVALGLLIGSVAIAAEDPGLSPVLGSSALATVGLGVMVLFVRTPAEPGTVRVVGLADGLRFTPRRGSSVTLVILLVLLMAPGALTLRLMLVGTPVTVHGRGGPGHSSSPRARPPGCSSRTSSPCGCRRGSR